jgi:polyhydroxyalkanoate synthesis regulator phasin
MSYIGIRSDLAVEKFLSHKEAGNMDVFKKAFLAGLGALSLSQERTQSIVEELVKAGKLKEKEGEKLFKEIMAKAQAAKKDIQNKVNEQVDLTLGKINQTTLDQIKKLEKRILELEKKRTAGKATGKRRAPGTR